MKVGEAVTCTVEAHTPPNSGTIIGITWDFDGTGAFPASEELDGTQESVRVSTSHAYQAPGTYFVSALVESHRDGEVGATSRRIPNLAAARVVVS